jgi:2-methylcitrate dehydratase PrpD
MSQDLAITSDSDRTLDLVTFLSNLKLEELPSRVAHHAKISILNSIGCGLSAAPLESHSKMISALDIVSKQLLGGPFRAATILARSERATIEDAAMLNGLAMTVRFFDDTHLSTVVHPSGPPLAALLAYAEAHHCSGQEVLLAFVVGVETMLAVATALGMGPYKRGWHTTSIAGTFGATAAIAKIMKMSPTQFAQALGHASSMTAGTRSVFGTDSLSMHAGRAAQNGLLATKMAREGLTSTTHALDKWIKLISHNDGDTTAVAALADASSEKDRKWMVLENTFKPYPCGIVSHPAIDAGVAAHDYFANNADIAVSGNLPQDAINIFSYIEASVTPLTIKLCGVRHPRDAMQTIFSTYHGIAVGLIYGRAGIREYATDVVNEPLIKEIRNRIRLTADDTLKDNQASLTVGYRGVEAETLRMHFVIKHAIGSLQNPMREEQLEKKFADQADIGGIDVEAVRLAIEDLWNLEIIEDIAYTMKYFVPQPISNRTD